MSTAVFPRALGPVLVEAVSHETPASLAGVATENRGQRGADLTIHRISKAHHGRTLLLLGHAAEHLANSRRFATNVRDDRSDAEAIHLLMGLSRAVFDDFAGRNSRRERVEMWLIEQLAKMVEGRGRRSSLVSDNESRHEDCVTC